MRTLFLNLDNTICESRQLVELKMMYELERLNKKYKMLIVSGAELTQMQLQCPIKYVSFMSQNGNYVWDNEQVLWQNELLVTEGDNIKRYIKLRRMKQWECLYIGGVLDKGYNDYSVQGVIPTFAVKSPLQTLNFLKTIW